MSARRVYAPDGSSQDIGPPHQHQLEWSDKKGTPHDSDEESDDDDALAPSFVIWNITDKTVVYVKKMEYALTHIPESIAEYKPKYTWDTSDTEGLQNIQEYFAYLKMCRTSTNEQWDHYLRPHYLPSLPFKQYNSKTCAICSDKHKDPIFRLRLNLTTGAVDFQTSAIEKDANLWHTTLEPAIHANQKSIVNAYFNYLQTNWVQTDRLKAIYETTDIRMDPPYPPVSFYVGDFYQLPPVGTKHTPQNKQT